MAKPLNPQDLHPNAFVFDLPRYTMIPNVIIDELMPKLTGGEFKVLLYIARRTFGFQRTRATITVEQIQDGHLFDGRRLDYGTGLSRRAVFECLQNLEGAGYVFRQKQFSETGSQLASTYTILARDIQNQVMYGCDVPVEPVEIASESVEKQGVQKVHPRGEGTKSAPYGGAESAPPIRNRKKEINSSPVVPSACGNVENSMPMDKCEKCGNQGLLGPGGTRTTLYGTTVREWRDAVMQGAEYCECAAGEFARSFVEMPMKGVGREKKEKNAS